MRKYRGALVVALTVAFLGTPTFAEEAAEPTAKTTPSSDEASSSKENEQHPDCMKQCLKDDEFEFDCASYCIFTV